MSEKGDMELSTDQDEADVGVDESDSDRDSWFDDGNRQLSNLDPDPSVASHPESDLHRDMLRITICSTETSIPITARLYLRPGEENEHGEAKFTLLTYEGRCGDPIQWRQKDIYENLTREKVGRAWLHFFGPVHSLRRAPTDDLQTKNFRILIAYTYSGAEVWTSRTVTTPTEGFVVTEPFLAFWNNNKSAARVDAHYTIDHDLDPDTLCDWMHNVDSWRAVVEDRLITRYGYWVCERMRPDSRDKLEEADIDKSSSCRRAFSLRLQNLNNTVSELQKMPSKDTTAALGWMKGKTCGYVHQTMAQLQNHDPNVLLRFVAGMVGNGAEPPIYTRDASNRITPAWEACKLQLSYCRFMIGYVRFEYANIRTAWIEVVPRQEVEGYEPRISKPFISRGLTLQEEEEDPSIAVARHTTFGGRDDSGPLQ